MNFREAHLAVRTIVQAAGRQRFTLSVDAVEWHPNRTTIRWKVFVPGATREQDRWNEHSDPAALVAWLAKSFQAEPAAADLSALEPIGEAPAVVDDGT